jgi:hypothetical protein
MSLRKSGCVEGMHIWRGQPRSGDGFDRGRTDIHGLEFLEFGVGARSACLQECICSGTPLRRFVTESGWLCIYEPISKFRCLLAASGNVGLKFNRGKERG